MDNTSSTSGKCMNWVHSSYCLKATVYEFISQFLDVLCPQCILCVDGRLVFQNSTFFLLLSSKVRANGSMAVSNKLRSEISSVAFEILSTQPTFPNASATIFPNIYGYVVYMPIFIYMWKQRTIYEVCLEIYIVGHSSPWSVLPSAMTRAPLGRPVTPRSTARGRFKLRHQ